MYSFCNYVNDSNIAAKTRGADVWRRAVSDVRDCRNNGGAPRTRYVSSDYFKYLCYLFQVVLILYATRAE